MGKWTAERWAAASGIGFVVLLLVGNLIPGSPKKYDASAATIVSWLHDKHKSLLVAAVLFGLAYIFFLWFLASFAGLFREAGERRLSTVIYGGGVALITIGAITDGVMVTLARVVSLGADDTTVKTLYDVDTFLYNRIYWFAAAVALAVFIAVWRTKVLAEWFGWLSALGAVVFVIGGVSMKSSGFFSPTGGMPFIAFLVFLIWVLVASLLLVQQTGEATMPVAATSM